MRVSASTCREQQAVQRRIADNDPLENRRKIATAAATAWGKEAAEAEKREARELKRRTQLELESSIQAANASAETAPDAR